MKKLLILLFPITLFSQENYFDTSISLLVNQKINEYRIENGLHPYIETDSLTSDIELYVKSHANELQYSNVFHHSDMKNSENICYVPSSTAWIDKEESYKLIRSADSIATTIFEAWKSSPGHNNLMLDKAATKIVTVIYVFYNNNKGSKNWISFAATQFLDDDWDLYLSYENLENK